MKLFVNNNFVGFYPIGTAAIVLAESVEEAVDKLKVELEARGLNTVVTQEQFLEINMSESSAIVLRDGNY